MAGRQRAVRERSPSRREHRAGRSRRPRPGCAAAARRAAEAAERREIGRAAGGHPAERRRGVTDADRRRRSGSGQQRREPGRAGAARSERPLDLGRAGRLAIEQRSEHPLQCPDVSRRLPRRAQHAPDTHPGQHRPAVGADQNIGIRKPPVHDAGGVSVRQRPAQPDPERHHLPRLQQPATRDLVQSPSRRPARGRTPAPRRHTPCAPRGRPAGRAHPAP